MLDVALRSLIHDRGKLIGSLAGVAFASTLLLVQIGVFVGLISTASAPIRRAGGDVWVMGRGTEVLDNGETLAASSRARVAGAACVTRVRGLIYAIAPLRKPSGALDYVEVVGIDDDEDDPQAVSAAHLAWGGAPAGFARRRGAARAAPRNSRHTFPWNLERGLVRDLEAPLRVAIDDHDLDKLQLKGDPLGAALEVNGQLAYVAGLTHGIRSFALYPYLFTHIDNARRLAGIGAGQAQYWVVDLDDPACAPALIAKLSTDRELEARSTEAFAAQTERYWVLGSGAGGALAFSALFSLVIGVVIVGQTLYSITREHLKELATLKAMGASRRELVGFVSWQASFIGVVGGVLGLGMAFALQGVLSSQGIATVLSPAVLSLSAIAVLAMCVLASVPSTRKVLAVEATEVFR